MKRTIGCLLVAVGATMGVSVGADGSRHVVARLAPHNEVPAVSSPASGRFEAEVGDDAVEYELSYEDLQAEVRQAHIHFAQPNVNGGIMVWLCGTTANPGPAGTQVCPQSGTITGTITASNVLAITSQGIAAGEFEEFVQALTSGLAYANVHTVQSGGGEVRGQIRRGRGHGRHDR